MTDRTIDDLTVLRVLARLRENAAAPSHQEIDAATLLAAWRLKSEELMSREAFRLVPARLRHREDAIIFIYGLAWLPVVMCVVRSHLLRPLDPAFAAICIMLATVLLICANINWWKNRVGRRGSDLLTRVAAGEFDESHHPIPLSKASAQ